MNHIKDISFALPEKPANIKFNSLTIIFFFLIFGGRNNYEKKIQIFFNILNTRSSNFVVANSIISQIISIYVRMCLFLIDIEFNSKIKSEAANIKNKEFFSQGKLENIIFFKRILMIYHNFKK